MNKNWKYVPFDQLFEWKEKSTIKSGDGSQTGKYKLFVCSDTEIKRYDEFLEDCEALVFGTGGKACCHYVNEKFAYSTDCVVATKKNSEIITKFYYYYFRQNRLGLLQATFKGSGLQHTSKKKISGILVPVVDFCEQKQIVEKIETMLSKLDESVETLQKTKQQLAAYRQAVLKDAFDTASAACELLPIEQLLTKQRKGMATGPFGTMLKKQEHKTSGVAVIGIENIGHGRFLNGNKIFVTEEKAKELKSFELSTGDIIISRSGTVGEICAIPERAKGALMSTNLIRISLNNDIILSNFFILLFQSKGIVLDQVKELCKGSTRFFLNQTILKQILFPIPTIDNQKRILKITESRMSIYEGIENTVDSVLQESEALRQSILKQAFEGNYV